MTSDSSSRVAVFVDGSNLYFAVRDGLHRQDTIDVEKLAKKLTKTRQLVRIYYYHVPRLEEESEATRRHQAFLNRLGYVDYLQLRLGRLVPRLAKVRCQYRISPSATPLYTGRSLRWPRLLTKRSYPQCLSSPFLLDCKSRVIQLHLVAAQEAHPAAQ